MLLLLLGDCRHYVVVVCGRHEWADGFESEGREERVGFGLRGLGLCLVKQGRRAKESGPRVEFVSETGGPP